jgi:2-deoxy-D-gluconate 3-dehydrogenase
MFTLKNKVAVVTGGNGGIGLGMARGLAGAGARVVVVARNADKSKAAVEELRKLGSDSFAIEADVKDEKAVAAMTDEVVKRCGGLNILINNVGTSIRKPVQSLALQEWYQVMDVNLTSAFLCSRAAYPHMKKAGGGKVISIGSMFAIFGSSYAPAYCASKSGVVQLTKSMAIAWAPDNIQVNCIMPGWVETELTQSAREEVAGLYERVLARTPAGRWGRTNDLAGPAVFLASAASDFITGTTLAVDGGYSVS